MRLLADPRTALQTQLTAATLALEALPVSHSLRVAGTRLLAAAREILAELPAELPPALAAAEKKQATAAARTLHFATRQLQKLWQKRVSRQLPSWSYKNRTQTESAFFAEWWQQLHGLPPALLTEFFGEQAEDTLATALAAWQRLAARAAARQSLLAALRRAAAAATALAALTQLVRLTPTKNGGAPLPPVWR